MASGFWFGFVFGSCHLVLLMEAVVFIRGVRACVCMCARVCFHPPED